MEKSRETRNQKHLRIVSKISAIFEEEFDDSDEIYFIIRTLRNIFLWEEEESHSIWMFGQALERFAKTNREYIKNQFNLIDK